MSPEAQALVALRTWAEGKPGVIRIVPRQLGRGEMGPFGRYRGGDGGPSPSEHLLGLGEGVSEALSPVSAINRPQAGDCVILRRCTSWEIPAPLPPWERADRVAKRRAVRALLAGTGTEDDLTTVLLGQRPAVSALSRAAVRDAVGRFLRESAGRAAEHAVNAMLKERFGEDAPIFAYGSKSKAAAVALLGTCETCGETPGPGEEEPIHQPWCPEVGGWWCNACQSWSGAGARCSGCYRQKSEAQVWSPYRNCPACDAKLEDTQGELASCSCGWKEGE